MEQQNNLYCRFCAEPKLSEKMVNLLDDNIKHEEGKINFLSTMYVDVFGENLHLPKTVCFVCYETFNKAYDFYEKVKKAQLTLFHIINDNKCDSDEDDRMNLVIDNVGDSDSIKGESSGKDVPNGEQNTDKVKNAAIEVKLEPKDEIEVTIDNLNKQKSATMDVQDILDAAMCEVPYSDIMLYAKEVTDQSKKIISEWKKYPWLCAHCNMEFLDVDALRLHSKTTHNKCNAFACIDCDSLGDADFETFVKHVKMHRKRLRKRCHYCDETVNDNMLPSHIKEHFSKNQISCNLCGEILKNNKSLENHFKEYNSGQAKRKPRRKRGTPITIEDLTCKLCSKVYKNPNSLRDHMKLHTSDRKRNYTCDRCGKMFFNKGTLSSHIMAHDQIKPHICRICNKSFLFLNMLRRHVDMHSGVKPFSCEQCGRCFRLQYQLNSHKIVHTDSMPHVCQYCNKAFRFKQILKNHERQHTGTKPYSCQSCGMAFTNWSNYNKHMKRRHNLDKSKKKITPEGVFPINPQTGELVQYNDAGTDEWKSKLMIPGKRGKKKVIQKEETV